MKAEDYLKDNLFYRGDPEVDFDAMIELLDNYASLKTKELEEEIKRLKEIEQKVMIYCERSTASALMEGFDFTIIGKRAKTITQFKDYARNWLSQNKQ